MFDWILNSLLVYLHLAHLKIIAYILLLYFITLHYYHLHYITILQYITITSIAES